MRIPGGKERDWSRTAATGGIVQLRAREQSASGAFASGDVDLAIRQQGSGVVDKLPVLLHFPIAGSYNSALERYPLLLSPQQTRTLPFGSRVAVWSRRETDMLPVAAHVPLIGSYNSAVAVPWLPPPA